VNVASDQKTTELLVRCTSGLVVRWVTTGESPLFCVWVSITVQDTITQWEGSRRYTLFVYPTCEINASCMYNTARLSVNDLDLAIYVKNIYPGALDPFGPLLP